MDLFIPAEIRRMVPLERRIETAVLSLLGLMRQRMPLSGSFSAGKDSSALMVVFFMAAERAIEEGLKPRLLVLHADTGIENPSIWQLARGEIGKIRKYAADKGIELEVGISQPAILDAWGPRIIGGRSLPSFPTTNSDCSAAWKIDPMARLRRQLLPKWGEGEEVVTLTGSRFSESAARGIKMRKRGEMIDRPFRNKQGDLVFSPLAEWSDDDVWELLGLVGAGIYPSYTDAADVIKMYADAGPSSCAVVNDAITSGSPARGGCGARFGCSQCQIVKTDKSMEHLLESDASYGYMKGLSKLREFVSATQTDFSRRLWVGRTIREGHIAIRPDVYSPAMMREILRYAVSLDAAEYEEARRLGIEPRFRLIPADHVIAIDFLWSLHGHWDGFAAISDYLDIWEDGVRYDIPTIEELATDEFVDPLFLEVGEDWADAAGDTWAGLRDPYLTSVLEDCIPERDFGLRNPVRCWDVASETGGFNVDPESLLMFFEFEARELVDRYRDYAWSQGRGYSARWYLQNGLVAISDRQVLSYDQALKRTAFKRLLGLNGEGADIEGVRSRLLAWDEVPEEVAQAFISEKRLVQLAAERDARSHAAKQAVLF